MRWRGRNCRKLQYSRDALMRYEKLYRGTLLVYSGYRPKMSERRLGITHYHEIDVDYLGGHGHQSIQMIHTVRKLHIITRPRTSAPTTTYQAATRRVNVLQSIIVDSFGHRSCCTGWGSFHRAGVPATRRQRPLTSWWRRAAIATTARR